jgi:hypothetical protein
MPILRKHKMKNNLLLCSCGACLCSFWEQIKQCASAVLYGWTLRAQKYYLTPEFSLRRLRRQVLKQSIQRAVLRGVQQLLFFFKVAIFIYFFIFLGIVIQNFIINFKLPFNNMLE